MAVVFDNIQPARILVRVMKFFGMWTYRDSPWSTVYRSYGWILHFHFTFLFILGMYINVFMAQNIDELSDALYLSLTEVALFVKVFNIMTKSRDAVDMMEIFEKNINVNPMNELELTAIKSAQEGFKRLRNMHIAGTMLSLLSSYLVPFFDKNYILPFPCWMPFDYQNDQNYFYAYGYVAIAITVTASSNCILDLFQSYLLLQLSICYKLLGLRLKNFGYKNNDNDELLKGYFDYYGFITGLTRKCEQILSLPVLVQLVLSAFVICFTVYKLQNAKFTENPVAFILLIVYSSVMSLQIYLPCNYGNELTINANELTNAVYSSNWINQSPKTRKEIFIFMEYLKQPVIVQAGKIFNIGMNIFSQTMNNAYRLYAVLANIET